MRCFMSSLGKSELLKGKSLKKQNNKIYHQFTLDYTAVTAGLKQCTGTRSVAFIVILAPQMSQVFHTSQQSWEFSPPPSSTLLL